MWGLELFKSTRPAEMERCTIVCGFGLADLTALTAAGVFSVLDGLRLCEHRANAMKEAMDMQPQRQICITPWAKTFSLRDMEFYCMKCKSREETLQVSACLYPGAFVCGGTEAAVLRLEAEMQHLQMQAILLGERIGAYHTSLVELVKEKLLAVLLEVRPRMRAPRYAVRMNDGTRITPSTEVATMVDKLAQQVVTCVQWDHIVHKLYEEDKIARFFEMTPAKSQQCTKLVAQILPYEVESTAVGV